MRYLHCESNQFPSTSLTVLLTAYGGRISGGTTGNTLNSTYENDRDNDGVVDTVYYYTYDIDGSEIKVEIDSNNDGVINEVCCYNLGKENKNKPL